MTPQSLDLSIIIPAYNEEENIIPLYREVCAALKKVPRKYTLHEIIFVDDGSTDDTFAKMLSLHEKDTSVRIIKFRKNFGQTAALDAAIKQAQGRVLIPLDADLQNDPADIPAMLTILDEGYDVVAGWRKNRSDPFTKKIASRLAHFLRHLIAQEQVHDSGCTMKAFRAECFDDLDLHGEMHRYIPALLSWRGFKIGEMVVHHRPRHAGRTKYSMSRLLRGFLDLIVIKFWMQYSARPIHLFGGLGVLSSVIGIIVFAYLLVMKLFFNEALANRPLFLISILLIVVGIQFVVTGLLSDIMIKSYYSRGRTPYAIEKVI